MNLINAKQKWMIMKAYAQQQVPVSNILNT